jgi:sugar/nucleoside kinase (ribokinase family)
MVRHRVKRLDCVCFGSMVFDFRTRMRLEGRARAAPLRILAGPEDRFLAGGVPILAMAMAGMGLGVAVMGRVGRDPAGYGLVGYLNREHGIDTEGVRFSEEATGYSVIRCTRRERHILHYRGANATCVPDRGMISLIRSRRPGMVAVGYAGLLPAMDANGGALMARFLSKIRSMGILTALDTHTVGKRYPMLRRPLRAVDVFVCNAEEARWISGEMVLERMLRRICVDHPPADREACRLFGVTVPNGAYLAYGVGTDMETGFVASPWHTPRPLDLTGAGDAFRAGLYSFLIRNKRAFMDGSLDWKRAGLLANRTAATAVTEGLEGVAAYPAMMKLCGGRPRTAARGQAAPARFRRPGRSRGKSC